MFNGIGIGLFGKPEQHAGRPKQKTPITFHDQPVRKSDLFSKQKIEDALKDTGTDGAMETPE